MTKVKDRIAPIRRAKRSVEKVLFRGWPRANWHWFDHPEMQARIANAEDDLASGRYSDASADEYLNRLRRPS
jgi:hypothetical protein